MALGKDYVSQQCSVARALEIVGERWTLLVVRDALYGVRRYNDFLVHLGIPRAVLAGRLQSLVTAGVLEKRSCADVPSRHEYVVTERGRQLWWTLCALGTWGQDNYTEGEPLRLFRHAACRTELGAVGDCPACRVLVPVEDVEMLPGPGLNLEPADPVSRALTKPRRLLQPIETDPV